MKNANDTSWDRTSDLPICSTASQPLCYRGLRYHLLYVGKRYISPVTGLERPRGFQEVKVPRFRDGTGWWQVVSLTHRPPLPPENTPGTHLC